jgi:hypothetical protein
MRSALSRWRRRNKRLLGLQTKVSSDCASNPRSLPGAERRRDSLIFGCLLLLLFVIYNLNLRTIGWDDSYPTRFLPFSLLLDHSLYLDQWVQPRLAGPLGPHGLYFAARSHAHWISMYPIIMPVLVTPLYVLPAWWVSHQSPPIYPYSLEFVLIVVTMEKLCASLIAAMSGAVLFLAFRKIASTKVSLSVALIYGLTSNTWAISSQALWRHGLTELSFAFLLWALFRVSDWRLAPFWAGLALAVAAANKPLEAIMIVPFLFCFGRRSWKSLFVFLIPFIVLGGVVFSYNLYFFARPLGAYPTNPAEFGSVAGQGGARLPFFASLGVGLAGLLVSPSRGLLIYTPWTAFAFWGAARVWKEKSPVWGGPLLLALTAIFVVQAGLTEGWFGGWCFGPRYLTDLLPFLAWFLVPLWTRIWARPVLRAAFVATVVTALWVQVVGAFYYPSGNWDGSPVNVDRQPRRLWDWSDNQILRSWNAGPAAPTLLDAWVELPENRSGMP